MSEYDFGISYIKGTTYLLLGNLKGQSKGTRVDTTPRRQLVFKGHFKPLEREAISSKV